MHTRCLRALWVNVIKHSLCKFSPLPPTLNLSTSVLFEIQNRTYSWSWTCHAEHMLLLCNLWDLDLDLRPRKTELNICRCMLESTLSLVVAKLTSSWIQNKLKQNSFIKMKVWFSSTVWSYALLSIYNFCNRRSCNEKWGFWWKSHFYKLS